MLYGWDKVRNYEAPQEINSVSLKPCLEREPFAKNRLYVQKKKKKKKKKTITLPIFKMRVTFNLITR